MDLFYCLILSGKKISPHPMLESNRCLLLLPQQELSHKDDDSEQRIRDQFHLFNFLTSCCHRKSKALSQVNLRCFPKCSLLKI